MNDECENYEDSWFKTPDGPWLAKALYEHRAIESFSPDLETYDNKLPSFFFDLVEACTRYEGGNKLALLDALFFCQDNNIPLPEWVVTGLSDFFVLAVQGTALGKRGRGNTPVAEARDTVKRWKRYETYRRIRLAQSRPDGDILGIIAIPSETAALINAGKIMTIGNTRDEALHVTWMSLRGTFAQCALSTLERSMDTFETAEDDTHMISHRTQVALGFATDASPELLGDFGIKPLEDFQ